MADTLTDIIQIMTPERDIFEYHLRMDVIGTIIKDLRIKQNMTLIQKAFIINENQIINLNTDQNLVTKSKISSKFRLE